MADTQTTQATIEQLMEKQMGRVASLIAEIKHPKSLYQDFQTVFLHPDFLALVSYSYLLWLAFETSSYNEATLTQVFELSDTYNPIISAYIEKYIDEDAFIKIKNTLAEEVIPQRVLVHLVRERCDLSAIGTPDSVIELALALLDIQAGETVGEVGSGVGGFLVTAAERNPKATFTGFEVNSGVFLISLMRNYMERGEQYTNLVIKHGDAFDVVEKTDRDSFDKVFSHYPLLMRFQFSGIGKSYNESLQKRLAQPSLAHSGDWVFNMLIWDLMKDSPTSKGLGIMTGGSSWNLTSRMMRKHFLDHGMIESVIALPQRLLSTENTPVMMIILGHNNDHVRMVDATSLYQAGRRQNELQKNHIEQIIKHLTTDSQDSK